MQFCEFFSTGGIKCYSDAPKIHLRPSPWQCVGKILPHLAQHGHTRVSSKTEIQIENE